MNLRGIANSMTRAVRPNQSITWRRSTGWTQDMTTGQRTATYQAVVLPAQVQALSTGDMRLDPGLVMQGNHRVLYINGGALGVLRNELKGGDWFLFNGQTWKATVVPENWDDCGWSRVIVTEIQQGGSGADVEPE